MVLKLAGLSFRNLFWVRDEFALVRWGRCSPSTSRLIFLWENELQVSKLSIKAPSMLLCSEVCLVEREEGRDRD